MEKVTDIFEKIKIDMCDNKCKYPSEYDMKDNENWDKIWEDHCEKCSLNLLG